MSYKKKGCLGYNLNNKGNYLQYVLVGSRNETSRGYFVANFLFIWIERQQWMALKKHFQLGDMKNKIKTGRTPLVGSRLGYQPKGQKIISGLKVR